MRLIFTTLFILSGFTSRYDYGVFEKVLATRQAGLTAHDVGKVNAYIDGFIAVEDCSLINKEVMACFENGCEHLLVVDCAGIADGGRTWMQTHSIAGEVDPDTFKEHKVEGESLKMHLYLIEYTHRYEYR